MAQENKKLLGFVGSLRAGSYNKMLMEAFKENLSAGMTLKVAEIGNLPLYNQDMERDFPAVVQALKEEISTADAIIISTPEFNRSIPGVLKNAIDWTSRPYGQSAWDGKKVLVVGASPGNIGTALAQYNLKQILSYLNTRTLGQPEFFLGQAASKFDANGKLADESTKEHIIKALEVLLRN